MTSVRYEETDCCIVGGGPAGLMLALLLARRGVRVTLLEAHKDFDREFRGNTLNPSALEILERLGLEEEVFKLRPAQRVYSFVLQANGKKETFADFSRLEKPYPYILMVPQARFLELVAREASRYPNFRLLMGARVRELVREGDRFAGAVYRDEGGDLREVRAALTVGADGRFSRTRKLAGLEGAKKGAKQHMDVFWFNLPRREEDPEGAGAVFRIGRGCLLVLMDHSEYWQVGYIFPKGGYARLKEEGLPALRRTVAALAPELADRVATLKDWKEGSLLSVESDRLRRWHRPGLLLLGDAAHVVSPIGGVGINLAIQDAVVAANVLADPLLEGGASDRHLRAVQRRRALPVRLVQGAQGLAQRWVVADVLKGDRKRDEPFELPRLLRILLRAPILRDMAARLIADGGVWPVLPKTILEKTAEGQSRREKERVL